MDRSRAEGDVGPIVAGRPGPLDEQGDAEWVLGRAFAGQARSLDAGCDVDADQRDRPRRPGHVRRMQPAGQGHRQFPGDRGGQQLGGTLAGAARVWPAGGVEEEAFDTAGEVGVRPRATMSELAAGSWWRLSCRRLRGRGRCSTFQVRRPIRRAASTDSEPLSWTTSGSIARMSAAMRPGVGIGGDGDDPGPLAGSCGRPDQPRQDGGLANRERPGRAGDDVEPDRIGTGADRGQNAVGIRDPTDLYKWAACDVRQISGRATGRDERSDGRSRVRVAHQRLADESAVEAKGTPARDDRRIAHPGFGDHQPVIRHALREAGRPARRRRRVFADPGC